VPLEGEEEPMIAAAASENRVRLRREQFRVVDRAEVADASVPPQCVRALTFARDGQLAVVGRSRV
jgi:hypothetical protein